MTRRTSSGKEAHGQRADRRTLSVGERGRRERGCDLFDMCDAVSTACWFALLSFDALALPQESDAMRA